MMRVALALLLLTGLSCTPTNDVSEPEAVCTVYGASLSWEEVLDVIPNEASAADSALLADRYIQSWITEQTVLNQAEAVLTEEGKDIAQALEKHRRSLLTHAYEEEFIRERLDTTVAESELQSFYDQNIENFELKDYIVQVRFCMLDSGDWDMGDFRRRFDRALDDEQEEIEAFCIRNRGAAFFDEDRWIYLQDLRAQVPLEIYNVERFLKKDKTIEFQRGNQVIFLRILDYKLKDSTAPFSLQRGKIRSMILNQRKAQLLTAMREDLFRQALKNNHIELHYERP